MLIRNGLRTLILFWALVVSPANATDLHYFVVDKSRSIGENNLVAPLTKALKGHVNTLGEQAEVRIIFFDSTAKNHKIWPSMSFDAKTNFGEYFAKSFRPGGNTRLFDTVAEVIKEVSSVADDYETVTMMILSDGEDSKKGRMRDWKEVQSLACDLVHAHGSVLITWYTLGFQAKLLPDSCIEVKKVDTGGLEDPCVFEDPPVARFEAYPTRVKIGEPVKFFMLPSPGKVSGVEWDFGDGAKGHEPEDRHAYATVGRFSVSLHERGPCGDDTAVVRDCIEVVEVIPPQAEFSWVPGHPRVGQDVQLINRSSGQPDNFAWTLGSYGNSIDASPTFTPTAPGDVTVSLTVTKGDQAHKSAKTIEVRPVPPDPEFALAPPNEIKIGQELRLIAKSKATSLEHSWTVAGRELLSGAEARWTADEGGMIDIFHSVKGEGGIATARDKIYVTGYAPPSADFTIDPNPVLVGVRVSIRASQDDPSWTHEWLIEGKKKSGVEIQWSSQTAATYEATHVAIGPGGTSTLAKTIHVISHPKPDPDFEIAPIAANIGGTVVIRAKATDASCRHAWVIGGQNFEGPSIDYPAEKPGAVEVRHTVTGPGGSASVDKSFSVVDPGLVQVVFKADPVEGKHPLKVQFTDMSTGSVAIAHRWEFGDGGTSPEKDPRYTYETAGVYRVTLHVQNALREWSDSKPLDIAVTNPLPSWIKWAVAVVALLIVGLIAYSKTRPQPIVGKLEWVSLDGAKGSISLSGTKFTIDRALLGQHATDIFTVEKRRGDDYCSVYRNGMRHQELKDVTAFKLEGVKFKYNQSA